MRREWDAILSLQRFVSGCLVEPWDVRLTVEAGVEPVRPYALIEQSAAATTTGAPVTQDVAVSYAVNAYLPKQETRALADELAAELRETFWQAFKVGPDLRRPTTDRVPLFSYEPRVCVQRVSVRGAISGTWTLTLGADTTDPIAFNTDAAGLQAALDDVSDGNTLVEKRATGIFDVHMVGDLAGNDVALMTLDASSLVGGVHTVSVVLHGASAPWRSNSDFMKVTSYGASVVRDVDDPTLVQVVLDLRCAFARGLPLPFGQMLLQRISASTSGD